ncbi:MAG: cytochrome c [Pseudomonadota bacterium]
MPRILFRTVCASLGGLALAACGGSNIDETSNDSVAVQTGSAAALVVACSGCHSSSNGAIASLDLYKADLLREAMIGYKSETDGTTVMHRIARGYSDEEIDLITAELTKP